MSLLPFISAIEKLPSPNEKKLALHQGNCFIDVYKNLCAKHYGQYIKEILPISITSTPDTASTFSRWYSGVTEPYETELNIGMCEDHKYNSSTTIWKNILDSLTISTKYFDGDPIIYHKSEMEHP